MSKEGEEEMGKPIRRQSNKHIQIQKVLDEGFRQDKAIPDGGKATPKDPADSKS